jgi:uncharacterized protein
MADRAGRSPLHYAALENDVAAIGRHVAAGADPNAEDALGFRPLHLAAQEHAIEAAAALLEAGAEVDGVNRYGNTPLFVAVFNFRGEKTMITLLREHGADPFVVNAHGQTPVGLARLIANYPVADLFEDLD